MAAAGLPAKRRHPERCRCDALRLSPRSGALRCRRACRADRRFSSREGEGNRPRGERRGFFLGITRAADWALCGGSPARVTALCDFIQLVLPPPRPLLTAGSSPPVPRAAETSSGPGAQVSRRYRRAPAGQTPTASPEDEGPGLLSLSRPAGSRADGDLKRLPGRCGDRCLRKAGTRACSARPTGRGRRGKRAGSEGRRPP